MDEKELRNNKTSESKVQGSRTSESRTPQNGRQGSRSSQNGRQGSVTSGKKPSAGKKASGKKKSGGAGSALVLKTTNFTLQAFITILFYVIVVLLIIKFSVKVYDFTYEVYGTVTVDKAPGRDVTITISEGETTKNVARKLELNRVVVDDMTFYIRTKLSGKTIFPGTYILNTSMSYEEILNTIADYETAQNNLEKQAAEKEKEDKE